MKAFFVFLLLSLVSSVKVIHFSDIHLDPFYCTGCPDSCESYDNPGIPCCRVYTTPKNDSGPSRYFGSYKCDSSPALVELTIYTASLMHPDVDVVLYSGD